MSFFTTSFRVPFPKAQLKEDNDEQIRNLLDTGIYPARLVVMRRGGVRALHGEKIVIPPRTRCKCNRHPVASTILAGAVIRYDLRRGRNREMWLGGLLLVPQWAETIGRRKQEVPDELATACLSVRNR
jgi:hypothetical protein